MQRASLALPIAIMFVGIRFVTLAFPFGPAGAPYTSSEPADQAAPPTVGTTTTEAVLRDHLNPLPANARIQRHVAVAGREGGGTAALDESTVAGAPQVVYSNTLGKYVFGLPDALAGARIADDIVITGAKWCYLDRYTTTVTGDKNGDGSGVGPFGIDLALYETCPGVIGATPIPGTEAHIELPDNGFHEITVIPSKTVQLPGSFYMGMRFNRKKCGIVVGAPPTVGFSEDLFDFPGFPCRAYFGGFPQHPHASFYTEIYVRDDWPSVHLGYRNSMRPGVQSTPGIGIADDIRLGVAECNLVAYDVGVSGKHFNVDLRSFLSNDDPENGGVIPGTRRHVFYWAHVSVLRVEVDPPIPLPTDFWIVLNNSDPVIVTGRQASVGYTEDVFAHYNGWEWVFEPFSDQVHAGLDVTIWCEGDPPIGACCDLVNTDEAGEAVCRELPEMNCGTSGKHGFFGLWRAGESCLSTC